MSATILSRLALIPMGSRIGNVGAGWLMKERTENRPVRMVQGTKLLPVRLMRYHKYITALVPDIGIAYSVL